MFDHKQTDTQTNTHTHTHTNTQTHTHTHTLTHSHTDNPNTPFMCMHLQASTKDAMYIWVTAVNIVSQWTDNTELETA